jgi:hypothetical protein
LDGLKASIEITAGFTVSEAGMEVPLGNVAVTLTFALAVTASVAALKVPLLALLAMLKLAGTVTADVLLLISVTVKPAGGAGPLRINVPTDEAPPVTEFGLKLKDMITGGFTVSMPVMLLAPSVAVTVTIFAVGTPTVVAVNVCEVLPPAIDTLAGTVTDGSELFRAMLIPPAGAAPLIATVPVELVPPVTVVGLKLTPVMVTDEGITVTFPLTVVEPSVAMTVTGVELATVPAVTTNVWLFWLAGTTTFAGVGKADVLLLLRVMVSPPAGAAPDRVTVPVLICPETTLEGLNDNIVSAGGFTPIVAVMKGP